MNATFIALVVGGFVMLWMGTTRHRGLKKYELNHRRDGRVVQFDTYEDFIKHESRKMDAEWTASVGLMFILAGGIGFIT
jgi:hypothetical protein